MERTFQTDRDPYRPVAGAERRKLAALNALLSDRRYRSALDAGCAGGEITRRLAPLCDRIVALDISETAIWRAMVNLSDVPNVSFARRNLRDFEPGTHFDLIVLGDVLPWLDVGERWSDDLAALCARLSHALSAGGRLAVASEFGSAESFRTAERYASLVRKAGGLTVLHEMVTGGSAAEARYVVSVFERPAEAAAAPLMGDVRAGAAIRGRAR